MNAELTEFARETGFDFLVSDPEIGMNIAYFESAPADLLYLSQVARFLISYDSGVPDSKRHAASLGKAYYGLGKGIYGTKLRFSPAKRDAIWRTRKASSAFVAADILSHGKLLQLNINSKKFASDVSLILSKPDLLLVFFGLVKWTQQRLEQTLDKTALKGARFPFIPPEVRAVQLSTTPTDEGQRKIMRSYKSNFE